MTSFFTDKVTCSNCNAYLGGAEVSAVPATACPHCGSMARVIACGWMDTATAYAGMGMRTPKRLGSSGRKRHGFETFIGPSWSRSLGKFVSRGETHDRDGDRYHEIVTDYQSGEVIHEHEEPLSKHVGHGADRPKHDKTSAG